MSDEYEVGYGKPPKYTRFQKGKSPNPSGRPKGSKNRKDMLQRTIMAPVTLTVNGKRKTVPAWEAMTMQQSAKALKGDLKSYLALAGLARELMLDDHVGALGQVSAAERAMMESMADQYAALQVLAQAQLPPPLQHVSDEPVGSARVGEPGQRAGGEA